MLHFGNDYHALVSFHLPVRRRYYQKRYERQQVLLELEIRLEREILRYISLADELQISKIDDETAVGAALFAHEFPRIDHVRIRRPGYLSPEELKGLIVVPSSSSTLPVAEDEPLDSGAAEDEASDAEEGASKVRPSYNYILNLRERDQVVSARKKRQAKLTKLEAELKEVKAVLAEAPFPAASIWRADLAELERGAQAARPLHVNARRLPCNRGRERALFEKRVAVDTRRWRPRSRSSTGCSPGPCPADFVPKSCPATRPRLQGNLRRQSFRLHGVYDGPHPDHSEFPNFVAQRWRETLASWGGAGHMVISTSTGDPGSEDFVPKSEPTAQIALQSRTHLIPCRPAASDPLRVLQAEQLDMISERNRPDMSSERNRLVFACAQDDRVYATTKYWGRPPGEPQIMVVPLPGRVCSETIRGFVTEGIPEDLRDAGVSDAGVSDAGVSDAGVSDAGVSDAGADFTVRHWPHGEAPAVPEQK